MNDMEKNGWKMTLAGIGLFAAGFLLKWFTSSAESFGLRGILYCIVIGLLCVAYIAGVYMVVRIFFGKKK